jgi:DNA polymerase-3 subunit beta
MKFNIAREALLAPLQQVNGVIEKRQTIPILSNVLIRVREGQIELTGSDLEIQLVAIAELSTSESGEFTVPARKLMDIFRLLPDRSEAQIDSHDGRCAIRSGGSRFNLSTLPVESYPAFDAGQPEFCVTVSCDVFKRALTKTMFSMAQQDVRYYLNGLLLDIEGSTLRTVSSDGHRLAVYEETLSESVLGSRQIIIPRKGVLELVRLFNDADDTLAIEFSPSTVQVSLGAVRFSAKLVDGRFPDYQKVMPKELDRSYSLEKDALKSALTRVSVLLNEKYKSISLAVNDQADMILKAQNPDHEEAEEVLSVVMEGGPVMVGFNPQYLLDAVNNIDSAQVKLSFSPSADRCLIEDPEDPRYKFIVMPMRL